MPAVRHLEGDVGHVLPDAGGVRDEDLAEDEKRARFWILDFGFWNGKTVGLHFSPKSEIQNLSPAVLRTAANLYLLARLLAI
jgi:hypothetical protein